MKPIQITKKTILTAITLSSLCTLSQAQVRNWTGGTGDWEVGANWSSGSVPAFPELPQVDSGVATINSVQTADSFRIAFNAGTTGTVNLNSGSFTQTSAVFAQNANTNATLNINGGTFRTNGNINASKGGATSTTNLNISGGAFEVTGVFLESSGSGTLNYNITGGDVAIQQWNAVAANPITFGGTSTLHSGANGSAGRTTFNSGIVNLTSNSTMHFDIGGVNQAGVTFDAGAGFYDLFQASSATVNLSGNLTLNLSNGFDGLTELNTNGTIIGAATLTGSFDNVVFGERLTTVGGEGSFIVSQVGNQVRISDFIAIPEPSTYALLAGLSGLLSVMLRRRR